MRFFNILTFICFLIPNSFIAQELFKIDSLHLIYKECRFNNLKKATEVTEKAVSIAKTINNDTLFIKSNYLLVEALYRQKKIAEANEIAQKTISLAQKTNTQKYLCLLYIYQSKINRRLRNYSESLHNIEDAHKIASLNNFHNELLEIANTKAVLLKKTKNYRKAIELLKNALKMCKSKINHNKAHTYSLLGGLYYNNLKIRNKDSASYYFEKGIKIIEKTNNNYIKSILYLNYGDLLLQKKQYKKALYFLNLAQKKTLEIHNYSKLYFINVSLGIYFFDTKNYPKAIEKYETALYKYGNYADGNQKANLIWFLADAYYYNKQFQKGYLEQEKLILFKDSLFTIEKNKTFEKLQTEYDVERKNAKIQLLQKQKELESQQKTTAIVIGLLLLIPSILLLLIYKFRIKSQKTIQLQQSKLHQKEKEQLQQQQRIKRIEGYVAGEEKEKNRIALELHDGIGGQLSGIKHYATSLEDSKEKTILLKDLSNVTKDIRLLSHSLSSSYSMQQPLTDLLQVLQEQYKNHFKITISIYPEEALQKISDKTKHFLHRTLQELINNIYKHANANLVTISLTIIDDIVLMIEDNGIGFDTSVKSKGIGLHNIQERVDNLQGQLSIDSTSRHGTTIIVKIPIHLGNKN
ncbi:conserved hypothetical protein [Tenacibaculum sp. 190524A02b]|uniref:histidine kinase n=1 Tax=Tenacibaculum vairaonense TaxID=3137860 RepID=A0ABM9PJC9_9FLAO